MKIGIDASRANLKTRTGTEWYSYHLIKNFSLIDKENEYILYTKGPLRTDLKGLGPNFKNRVLKWPPRFLWNQIRLSLEMLLRPPDVLFVPAHTIPLIHPKNTITTCHDIGFEHFPELYAKKEIGWKNNLLKRLLGFLVRILTLGRYSNNELDYHRFSMHFAVKHARLIITPSYFTAQEIQHFYTINPERIKVTHLGFNRQKYQEIKDKKAIISILNKYKLKNPFIVFIGRLEHKKNIKGIINSFYIFKKQYKTAHKLVLIGKRGYGFEEARKLISNHKLEDEVIELGWIDEEEVSLIYKAADLLLFLSFYEGFGLPPIEAMASGLPVIASNRGSLPEILKEAALIVDPVNYKEIARSIYRVVSDQKLRDKLIKAGQEQVKQFSWSKCARKTHQILTTLNP